MEEESQAQGSQSASGKQLDRIDLELIVIGKRLGFSLDELNEFRVRDLLALSSIFTGKGDNKPRMATQADIDRFFA